MSHTIVILSERAFTAADAQEILGLHEGQDIDYQLIVPVDSGTGMLTRLLDDLSLLDLKQFVHDLKPQDPDDLRRTADETLATCLEELRAAGGRVQGSVTTKTPLGALGEAVEHLHPQEIVIVTRPRAVEDTFHTDWASVARDTLGLPVLHLYGGTGLVG